MELLTPTTATVIARYRHPAWGRYAAITRNQYGRGEVTYLGFMPSEILIEKLMTEAVTRAGLSTPEQQAHFPVIVRSGTLRDGHPVHYLLNYSPEPSAIPYGFPSGRDLLTERAVPANSSVQLGPWGFAIVEED
jgi:beta-galactosidase